MVEKAPHAVAFLTAQASLLPQTNLSCPHTVMLPGSHQWELKQHHTISLALPSCLMTMIFLWITISHDWRAQCSREYLCAQMFSLALCYHTIQCSTAAMGLQKGVGMNWAMLCSVHHCIQLIWAQFIKNWHNCTLPLRTKIQHYDPQSGMVENNTHYPECLNISVQCICEHKDSFDW